MDEDYNIIDNTTQMDYSYESCQIWRFVCVYRSTYHSHTPANVIIVIKSLYNKLMMCIYFVMAIVHRFSS